MESKHIGKIIIFYVLMFVSSFGGAIEELFRQDYDYNNAMGYGFLITLLNILLVTFAMMLLPLMCRIIKKKLLPYKAGKRICLWNSIALFILSCILMAIFEIGFIGGIGALFFYFINKWIFVEPTLLSQTEIKIESANTENEIDMVENVEQNEDLDIDKMSPQEAAEYLVAEQLGEKYIPENNKTKVKYCSQCGSQIDPVTKKCTGCGKQYFKGIKLKKCTVWIIVLSVVLLVSVALNIYLYSEMDREFELEDKTITLETQTTSNSVVTMKVAIELFPPYSWVEDGNYYGLHVDLAKEIAKRTDKNVIFVVVDFDDMISGVDSGLYDMAFGLERTSSREEIVAFTDEYYDGMCAIYHTKGEKPSFSEWTEYTKILNDVKEDGTLRQLLSKYNLS